MEITFENPISEACAPSTSAAATAPDCETSAIDPDSAMRRANVALSPIGGRMMPRQLGPIMRTPCARAAARTSVSSNRPSAPVSPKPAERTTALRDPARPASSMTVGTVAAGVVTRIRSIRCPISAMEAWQGRPATLRYLGLTATSSPVYPLERRLSNAMRPREPARSLAPITATLRGAKRCSR